MNPLWLSHTQSPENALVPWIFLKTIQYLQPEVPWILYNNLQPKSNYDYPTDTIHLAHSQAIQPIQNMVSSVSSKILYIYSIQNIVSSVSSKILYIYSIQNPNRPITTAIP